MPTAVVERDANASRLRRTARDLWCLLREQGPGPPLAEARDVLRRRFYMKDDQLVVRQELVPDDAPPGAGAIRMELAAPHHLPVLAEFNRRQCNTRRTHRFVSALADGKRALLGFRDGRLIGYF